MTVGRSHLWCTSDGCCLLHMVFNNSSIWLLTDLYRGHGIHWHRAVWVQWCLDELRPVWSGPYSSDRCWSCQWASSCWRSMLKSAMYSGLKGKRKIQVLFPGFRWGLEWRRFCDSSFGFSMSREKSFFRISEPFFLGSMLKEPVWMMVLMLLGCVDKTVGNISFSSCTVLATVKFSVVPFLTRLVVDSPVKRVSSWSCLEKGACGIAELSPGLVII